MSVTLYTFQTLMADIQDGSVTTTSDVQVLITRQAYSNIITNSNGQISYVALPIMAVNIINFSVSYFNNAPNFPFVVNDFTTATDWLVYTLPT